MIDGPEAQPLIYQPHKGLDLLVNEDRTVFLDVRRTASDHISDLDWRVKDNSDIDVWRNFMSIYGQSTSAEDIEYLRSLYPGFLEQINHMKTGVIKISDKLPDHTQNAIRNLGTYTFPDLISAYMSLFVDKKRVLTERGTMFRPILDLHSYRAQENYELSQKTIALRQKVLDHQHAENTASFVSPKLITEVNKALILNSPIQVNLLGVPNGRISHSSHLHKNGWYLKYHIAALQANKAKVYDWPAEQDNPVDTIGSNIVMEGIDYVVQVFESFYPAGELHGRRHGSERERSLTIFANEGYALDLSSYILDRAALLEDNPLRFAQELAKQLGLNDSSQPSGT